VLKLTVLKEDMNKKRLLFMLQRPTPD